MRANASRDFGLLNVARSERYEWRRRAQAFCIVMQAAPPHAAHHSLGITAGACTETTPVTPEVFGLLPTVRYNLRAQTGGREAQERPMTACIDNSRAGLAGA